MKKILILLVLFPFALTHVNAQDFKPSNTQFMVRGYGHTGLNFYNVDGDKTSTFVGAAFSPIFLFKYNNKFIFESELEFELEGNKLNIGLEYADMMYVINNYITVRAGKFLLPFGTFMERLHPSWINRFSNKPLGFGHDGIAPSSDIGLEVRGAFPVGVSTLNYAVYVTNGPRLKTGDDEPDEAGMLLFVNYDDNNLNKAVGGRIGLLPFSNSSFEVGFSVYYAGNVGDTESEFDGVDALLWAGDLSFVKQITPIRGIIDIKGQYNHSQIGDAVYNDPGDAARATYTFNNQSSAYYAQLGYRPSMSGNNILKNIELVTRYSTLQTPDGSLWEGNESEMSFGINYWLSWRSVIKANYHVKTKAVAGTDNVDTQAFYLHWAIGL